MKTQKRRCRRAVGEMSFRTEIINDKKTWIDTFDVLQREQWSILARLVFSFFFFNTSAATYQVYSERVTTRLKQVDAEASAYSPLPRQMGKVKSGLPPIGLSLSLCHVLFGRTNARPPLPATFCVLGSRRIDMLPGIGELSLTGRILPSNATSTRRCFYLPPSTLSLPRPSGDFVWQGRKIRKLDEQIEHNEARVHLIYCLLRNIASFYFWAWSTTIS